MRNTSREHERDIQWHGLKCRIQAYRPEEISLSYNGGKDCLVLLILILACLAGTTTTTVTSTNGSVKDSESQRPSKPAASSPATLQAIYIAPHDPFPEVEDFVESSTLQYYLHLRKYSVPMRSALEAYSQDRPNVKAIFMGTRRTDPHCEFLAHFSPTDKDWPQFMRVNPVIDWHYVEIWAVSSFPPHSFSSGDAVWIRMRGRLHVEEGHLLTWSCSSSAISESPFAACISEASHHWAA